MSIDAKHYKLEKMLKSGEYYRVPKFQRGYAWGDEQLEDLWNDLQNTDVGESHFMGSIIAYYENENLMVTDGQQRLTTLFILISQIRRVFLEIGEDSKAEGTLNYLINRDNHNRPHLKIYSENASEKTSNYLKSILQNDNVWEVSSDKSITKTYGEELNNIIYASDFFYRNINSLASDKLELSQKISELFDKVLSLGVVSIVLESRTEAFRIFSTLNSRGMSLSIGDLIKNQLFSLLKNDKLEEEFHHKWDVVTKNLDEARRFNTKLDSDLFFLYTWFSRGRNVYVTQNSLVQCYEDAITKDNVNEFIEDFILDSELFRYALDADHNNFSLSGKPIFEHNLNVEIKSYLKVLNSFRVTKSIPAILSLLRILYFSYSARVPGSRKIKKGYVFEAFELIIDFQFKFNAVCGWPNSWLPKTAYSKFARDSFNYPENLKGITQSLKYKFDGAVPSLEDFESNFFQINWVDDVPLIKYILTEYYKHINLSTPFLEQASVNLEHLKSRLGENDEFRTVNKIGNLFLVDKDFNANVLKTKSPSEKIELMLNSGYTLPDYVADSIEWGDAQIEHHTREMAKLSYNEIWNRVGA